MTYYYCMAELMDIEDILIKYIPDKYVIKYILSFLPDSHDHLKLLSKKIKKLEKDVDKNLKICREKVKNI